MITENRGQERPPDSIRGMLLAGSLVLGLLVLGLGGWAANASLSGAVFAQGLVVVDSNVKKVQHPFGGVVDEIRVQNGSRVQAGDLLLRLDETVVRANLQIVAKQLDELAVRTMRLTAERDGATSVSPPPSLAGHPDENHPGESERAAMIAGERSLFESRLAARNGQKAQLRERVAQLRLEIEGLVAQQSAKSRESELVKKELAGIEKLWSQNLVPVTKFMAMQREQARLEGERAQLMASAAQARGKIAETDLQILQLDQDLRADVIKELRETEAKEAELAERRVQALDQLRHIDIRAPQAGFVHELTAHTVGGVIAAGEVLMLIVPDDDALVIEARVAPQDIDQVHAGAPAFIRFSAFDRRSTPEFEGVVTRVSADLVKEPQTGATYYLTRLALADWGSARPDGRRPPELRLVPGMPADIHIRTGERTALSYFLKPLRDQFARAFTER